MKDTASAIIEALEQLRGKSEITNALKRMGGGEEGSMVDGLIHIVSILQEDKVQCVKIAGICGAVLGASCVASAVGGMYLYAKQKEKRACRKKMERVAEILRQEASLHEVTQSAEAEMPIEKQDVPPPIE